MDINSKIIKKYNEYIENIRKAPEKLILSYDSYFELYKWCMFNYTRDCTKPLILVQFATCNIELAPLEQGEYIVLDVYGKTVECD